MFKIHRTILLVSSKYRKIAAASNYPRLEILKKKKGYKGWYFGDICFVIV